MATAAKQTMLNGILKWSIGLLCTLIVAIALLIFFVVVLITPNLPSLDAITDYRPKIPLRVYTADHVLIGEFGAEHRDFVPINQIPDILKKALLTIEDDRFYQHDGVDFLGVARAGLADLHGGLSQGASTITMQVARNFYLSKEKTYLRKLYEALLAMKIERELSKDKILELYMNQIYLGQRAYGFASAAQVYFGKSIKTLTIGEAAMLAGLPKAPSAYNPIVNPERARQRQHYILLRMRDLGYITPAQYNQALQEDMHVHQERDVHSFSTHAEYVAEMVRQLMVAQFKEAAYTSGLSVYTTITKRDQDAAYTAVRQGAIDYERRHGYRGPEAYIKLPDDQEERTQAIDTAFDKYPSSDDLQSAIVLSVNPTSVRAQLSSGEAVEISGDGLKFAASALTAKASAKIKIKPGSVIRIERDANAHWAITQLPEVASAFVSLDSSTGAVQAMVGGFDFNINKFDHANQAWRQPGSSFKPFVYSAALERGFSPATVINDAPLFISAKETGSTDWEPHNDEGEFDGPVTMRTALAKSKNVVSVRILRAIGPEYVHEYVDRFGFDAAKIPAHLSMALGTGLVTPFQMARAYAVFANGGYRINPYLIAKVVDANGKALFEATPDTPGQENARVIDPRNAFIMDTMLKTVARFGTGHMASAQLGRTDIAGKTGTTSDAVDGWFAGYGANIVSVAWMGYDDPRSLGSREFGATLALPIWIDYMKVALQGKSEVHRPAPAGVIMADNDWIYSEFAEHGAISSLGFDEATVPTDDLKQNIPTPPANPAQEKARILDLFR
ncbi:MAG TPA: penicillin-binding protein 1A [Burkholderiaceae bacterium]|jgi:penicillin-binding protein 1A